LARGTSYGKWRGNKQSKIRYFKEKQNKRELNTHYEMMIHLEDEKDKIFQNKKK
jgi:hypothetical protein